MGSRILFVLDNLVQPGTVNSENLYIGQLLLYIESRESHRGSQLNEGVYVASRHVSQGLTRVAEKYLYLEI